MLSDLYMHRQGMLLFWTTYERSLSPLASYFPRNHNCHFLSSGALKHQEGTRCKGKFSCQILEFYTCGLIFIFKQNSSLTRIWWQFASFTSTRIKFFFLSACKHLSASVYGVHNALKSWSIGLSVGDHKACVNFHNNYLEKNVLKQKWQA